MTIQSVDILATTLLSNEDMPLKQLWLSHNMLTEISDSMIDLVVGKKSLEVLALSENPCVSTAAGLETKSKLLELEKAWKLQRGSTSGLHI
jgi:hypothetical protein